MHFAETLPFSEGFVWGAAGVQAREGGKVDYIRNLNFVLPVLHIIDHVALLKWCSLELLGSFLTASVRSNKAEQKIPVQIVAPLSGSDI